MKAFGSGLRALGMTPQPDIKDFNQAVRPPSVPPIPPSISASVFLCGSRNFQNQTQRGGMGRMTLTAQGGVN